MIELGCMASGLLAVLGASVPWTSYEAEDGKTNADVHGPIRTYHTPESESSGRMYTRLDAAGEFVEFRVKHRANGLVLRYCIPDSADGDGMDATLGLYINGKFSRKIKLTSKYAWSYGEFPWSNAPSLGKAHHFFDEIHAIIDRVDPGDRVRLQKDASDRAGYYLIDMVELEQIPPPLPRLLGSLSIVDFGAIPDDAGDDTVALGKCMEAARKEGKTVWIPEGVFLLNGPRIVVSGVRVLGAGMWYSKFVGSSPFFEGGGGPVEFSDLAIFGDIAHRNDNSPDNAFNGNFGRGSIFRNLWIEHMKCGFWTTHGTAQMRVEGCRIRNTMADGLNFCGGTSRSVVEQCHLRNTGDDALATWSPNGNGTARIACVQNSFYQQHDRTPVAGERDRDLRGS